MATVLLVEDEQDAAEIATAALRKAGHRVMSVANGQDALALLRLLGTDVVVTDLRMPVTDGLSLLAEIRSLPRWQSLPAVVFTAMDRAKDDPRLRALDVSEVLVKGSADLADLVAAVGRVVPPPAKSAP